MNDLVSVIMPVYNSEQYLEEAINSVLSQTYKNFELIIINDSSTDKTKDILRSFTDTRIKLENLKSNVGITKALNLGIKVSSGKYLLRMDSDDICLRNRFANQVRFMTQNPNIAVSSGEAIVIHNDNITGKILRPPRTHRDCLSALVFGSSCFIHPATIMRRTIFLEGNLYDPNYLVAQDYELWTRLVKVYAFGNLPKKLIYYRISNKNISFLYKDSQKANTLKANKILLFEILSPYISSSDLSSFFEFIECFKTQRTIAGLDLKHLDNIWKNLPEDVKSICYKLFKEIIRKNIMKIYWNPKDQISWTLLKNYFRYRLKNKLVQ
ncbi:MAG: glycosyltransferase [Rhodobacteraceae bacterium]|nr:glycosyltransferase [Paracoccaceae bacterium]